MENIGGSGAESMKVGKRDGKSVAQNPGANEARLVLKRGTTTNEGNFGRIDVADNSGEHPYGAH